MEARKLRGSRSMIVTGHLTIQQEKDHSYKQFLPKNTGNMLRSFLYPYIKEDSSDVTDILMPIIVKTN
jgi:hypothetical protein